MKGLKKYDRVLVRDRDDQEWQLSIFENIDYEFDDKYIYKCQMTYYTQCIPYEGNEDLLGTTKKPNRNPSKGRKPKFKTLYWYIDETLFLAKADIWLDVVDDIERYEVGNCFKTEGEAKEMADKIKKLLKEGCYDTDKDKQG